MNKLILHLLFTLSLGYLSPLMAQTPTPADEVKARKSPMAVAIHKTEKTYIKVVYCQPSKRGREVFGGIVPYGKVWRTGANEATEITVSHKMKFGGKNLAPGTYSLFTIPDKDKWTVIVNKELGLWGHYDYKPDNDVLRIEVPSKRIKTTYESFTVRIDTSAQGTTLVLNWDDVEVSIPLGVE